MSWQKALNEVQALLTQGGVPSNHAADIASRLSYSLQDFYDSRQSQGGSQELNANSPQTAAYKNAFRSPESVAGGKAGKDGTGAYAWATGATGTSGQDGTAGQDGTGQAGQDGTSFGGGLTIDISRVPCSALEAKLQSCGLSTGKDGKDGKTKCPPGGPFPGLEICSILDQQAKELAKQRARIVELEDKVAAIQKMLADTVACT